MFKDMYGCKDMCVSS